MTWIEELQDELRRQQPEEPPRARREEVSDDDVARTVTLVRRLLDQMNRELLAGRGSVWEAQARWGVRLWELWWGGTRTEGQYIVVTLLQDSRGTPYVKVHRRRLAFPDPRFERRLQWALQAAFLHPSVFTPRVHEAQGTQQVSGPIQTGEGSRANGSK